LNFIKALFRNKAHTAFKIQLKNVLGFSPNNISLYQMALSHRSIREGSDENNERLEFLGDAVLSSIVAHHLFKKYPYKGEGFLTEMRSKMVNRQKLNEIALKMGIKKLAFYNKFDNGLKGSQIFGNTRKPLLAQFTSTKDMPEQSGGLKNTLFSHTFFLKTSKVSRSTLKTNCTDGPTKTVKQ